MLWAYVSSIPAHPPRPPPHSLAHFDSVASHLNWLFMVASPSATERMSLMSCASTLPPLGGAPVPVVMSTFAAVAVFAEP